VKAVPFEPLDPGAYRELVRRALAEDFGWGDITTETLIERGQRAKGALLAKSRCALAGLDIACEAFRQLDPGVSITCHFKDSDRCDPGAIVAELNGDAGPMLTAERTALNYMQRLTGIATLTRAFVDAAAGRITILDTRKTTPMMRTLEKYAVRAGGGANHRFGLDDAVLVKDNHLALAGGVTEAVRRARARVGHLVKIEVEVDTLDQLDELLGLDGVDAVLLDNLGPDLLLEAVRRVGGRLVTEASGGITPGRARALAEAGVDLLSVGWLTHSPTALDVGLDLGLDLGHLGPGFGPDRGRATAGADGAP
jgi:nicotinate-nucleotide pyrophosphorylase (carboxylating)